MTAIEAIRKQIIQDTGLLVIPANTGKAVPSLPYAVMNVTSPYIAERGHPNETTYEDESGLYLKYDEQYRSTLSFTIFAADNQTTMDKAKAIRHWFLFFGQEFIQEQNVAVVNVGNTEDRTTFLVDSYEYKHGFDVQLRLSDELIKQIDWIETVELEMEE